MNISFLMINPSKYISRRRKNISFTVEVHAEVNSDIKLQTFPVEFFEITGQGLMRPVNDHLSYIKTSRQKILI